MKLFAIILLTVFFSHTEIVAESAISESPVAESPSAESNYASLLNSYLDSLDSYEANFQQQIVSSSRRLMDSSSGKFLLKKPNRFRWQINTPYEQTIIADGQYLWSIDQDLEQVTVADLESNLVNSPIMLLSGKENQLDDYFTVKMIETETEEERFLLTPIDDSSNFERVQLGFKQGTLYLIELFDSLGQVTIVTMTNIRNNPVIGDTAFIYQEIPEFDLIDSRNPEQSGD